MRHMLVMAGQLMLAFSAYILPSSTYICIY